MKAFVKLLVFVVATSITALPAQQTKIAPKRTITGGTLSGRAFGVTDGGDVKPAILADAFLFYEGPIHSDGTVVDVNEDNTTGLLFMSSLVKEKEPTVFKMELDCRDTLIAYYKAVSATLDGVTKNESWQIVIGQTDEKGYFNLRVPRQGAYVLVVEGQAGANDAVWEQDEVHIFTGKTTDLKIGSPAESCLKTGGD